MPIYFLCPDDEEPFGEIRTNFRHAAILRWPGSRRERARRASDFVRSEYSSGVEEEALAAWNAILAR